MQKAIEKINAEMQKEPTNEYMEIIGHYIIDRCTDEATAEKILAEDKSLGGALAEIKEKAREKATNGCAVIRDEDVFSMVDEYFGFGAAEEEQTEENSVGLHLDFESLLM